MKSIFGFPLLLLLITGSIAAAEGVVIEFTVTNILVAENAGFATILVYRRGNLSETVSVDYSTMDGSAIAGEDYVPQHGTLTFERAQTGKSFTVPILDDCRIEPDKWLRLTLGNPQGNAQLGTNIFASVIIQDNERPGSFALGYHSFIGVQTLNGNGPALALLPGGTALVGGESTFGTIIRLRSDGSLYPGFSGTDLTESVPWPFLGEPLIDTSVDAIYPAPDGSIVVGCWRQSTDLHQSLIIRLHSDGSFDRLLFSRDNYGNNRPIAVQADEKILLSTPDGPARLNKDGSPDTSFRPAITSPAGSDSAVLAAGIQQDQRIVLAGSFDLEGTNFNGIVRLNSDGSLDSTFLPVETLAERIVPQPDGRILLGGSFSQINGFFRPGLARLLSDGSLDSDFDPSDGFDRSLQPLVTDVVLQQDGRIIIAGTSARGLGYPVARLLGELC